MLVNKGRRKKFWKKFPNCYKCSALKTPLWYNTPPLRKDKQFQPEKQGE